MERCPDLHAILSRDGQKCVHVELRMRITTRPQDLHDWERPSMTLDPKIKFFPISQNTTGESEQQQIKLVWRKYM